MPLSGWTLRSFAVSEDLTRKHWRQALRAGSTVLDLSGALDQETGVLVRAPWLGSEAATVDLFTPAVVPAHPAALALALLLERLQQAAAVRFAAATVLEPASEFGRAAMDELHQQTVNLLSFQALPRAIYDAQVAYNLLSGLGEGATVSLTRWRRGFAGTMRRFRPGAGRRWPCRWFMRRCFTATRFQLRLSWSGRWRSQPWKRR